MLQHNIQPHYCSHDKLENYSTNVILYLSQREGVTEGMIHQLSHLLLKPRHILTLVGSSMIQNQLCNTLALK